MDMTFNGAPSDGMNWLEFVASLISSLAWPVALTLIIMLFRQPLSDLIDNIKEASWGDGSVKIDRKLEDAENTQKLVQAEMVGRVNTSAEATAAIAPRHDDLDDRFTKLASVAPAMAILDMWIRIEERLASLASQHGLPVEELTRSANRTATILRQKAILPTIMLKWLQDMRQVRNAAAHKSDGVSMTEALRFQELGKKVLTILDQI